MMYVPVLLSAAIVSTKHRIKPKTKNGQPSHTAVQKLENSPTAANVPT